MEVATAIRKRDDIEWSLVQRAQRIASCIRRCAETVIEIGTELIAAKGELQSQGLTLEQWLQESENGFFEMSVRTAYNYMAVAERFGHLDFSRLQVAPSALYLMASESCPDAARERLVQEAAEGKRITYSYALATVRELRAAEDDDSAEVEIVEVEEEVSPAVEAEEVIEVNAPAIAPAVEAEEVIEVNAPAIAPAVEAEKVEPMVSTQGAAIANWFDIIPHRAYPDGIDLDPTGSEITNHYVRARQFCHYREGMGRSWQCDTLWMCPPLQQQDMFIRKLVEEWQSGHIRRLALALLSIDSSTLWLNQICPNVTALCFLSFQVRLPVGVKPAVIAVFATAADYETAKEVLCQLGSLLKVER